MPPQDNSKNNIPNLDIFKIGNIDPVFKTNVTPQKNPNQNIPISVSNVLNNQKYTPSVPEKTATIPIPTQATNSPKSIVRTFKDDMQKAIESDHLSSINIAIAQNQKMRAQIKDEGLTPETEKNEFSKNKVIIFVSSILIVIGIIAISFTFIKTNSPIITDGPVQEIPSLITVENISELSVDAFSQKRFPTVLSNKLSDSQTKVNTLYYTYLTTGSSTTKRFITATEFVSLMQFNIPDILKRSLQSDFMVGMYSFGNNLPFVILKTTYFENTYAGMLDWEKNLEKDFRLLFKLSGYDSTAGVLNDLSAKEIKSFEDSVVVNKDVRLIRGEKGETMFLYGIIDQNTIIITVNEQAFQEIVTRLIKEKSLKR